MTFRLLLSTPGRQFAAIAIVLTAVRVLALVFGHPDLGPDEGQYWFWSKAPAFGYFSKPPVVAWSIAATTSIFGDSEWAVRLSAPLYHCGAAVFLFLLCRRLVDARTGFYAGVAWLTLPGVFLSSTLITTDAPLIFFWSAALYLFFVLSDESNRTGRTIPALLLGLAIGFGFLSKYAMIYFILGAAFALAAAPTRRRACGAVNIALACVVALLVLAPNIWWNSQNGFQTISHTAANANWGGDAGHPDRLLEFLGAQIGVAGPLFLIIILAAARFSVRTPDAALRNAVRPLLAFALPALAIVTVQSFISRAHGNWAAVAYPSLTTLAAIFVRGEAKALPAMKYSVALNAAIGAGFLVAFVNAPIADSIGASAAFKRLRGWEEIGAQIADRSTSYDVIMTDDREVSGELVYYARAGRPVVAWNSNRSIDSHFEAFHPFDPARHRRVLYVSERADALYVQEGFRRISPIGEISAATGPSRRRTLYLFEVGDPVAP